MAADHLPHDYDTLRDLAFIYDMAGSREPNPQIQHKLLSIADHLRAALRLLAEVDELKGKPSNAHTLTLKFHRFLSQEEWQRVAEAVTKFVPFVREMDANAVPEQDPRYKHILSSDYYEPGKKEGA